jgi:branched-chain amino acid transport system ATP-binding protein
MVTGLIGPNGAGKTTLFNVITGLQRPDRGEIFLSGEDITGFSTDHRARLGMARTFQRLELFWSLSVLENVQVGAETQSRVGTLERAQALLNRVGIGNLASERADALPTGAARLVELARALAIGPKVLLLDEPGSGLDDTESVALGDLLLELAASGMAILIVEHDMDLLMRICSQVYVLDFGEMIAAGNPAQIQANPLVQAAYLGTEIGVDTPPPPPPAPHPTVPPPPGAHRLAQPPRPAPVPPPPAPVGAFPPQPTPPRAPGLIPPSPAIVRPYVPPTPAGPPPFVTPRPVAPAPGPANVASPPAPLAPLPSVAPPPVSADTSPISPIPPFYPKVPPIAVPEQPAPANWAPPVAPSASDHETDRDGTPS